MKELIKKILENKETISVMESATGGYIANSITNIEGSSLVFKFGAVTYSNEFKIKMGVSSDIINKYSVYSMECAKEMSQKIAEFTNSTYGIGITGKMNVPDPNNNIGLNNIVYLSIYNSKLNTFLTTTISTGNQERIKNKELVLNTLITLLKSNIK